jgi:hypothetical protein
MFHDIVTAYADALYVATTLRPPVSTAPTRCGCQSGEGRKSSAASIVRIVGWLRARLHGFAAQPRSRTGF